MNDQPADVTVVVPPPPPSHADSVREKLATRLVAILAGAILTAVAVGSTLAVTLDSLEPLTLLVSAVVTPVVGVVGPVIGFYFGQRSNEPTPS